MSYFSNFETLGGQKKSFFGPGGTQKWCYLSVEWELAQANTLPSLNTPRLVTLTVGIPRNDIWLELLIGISYLLSKKLDTKKIGLEIYRMSEYPVYQPYIIKNPAYKLWLWSCSYFRRLNLDQISKNTRDLERTFQKLQSETNLDFLAQFV